MITLEKYVGVMQGALQNSERKLFWWYINFTV